MSAILSVVQLKSVCVPLLAASLLSPSSIPNVLKLLTELLTILRDVKASGFVLTPSLLSYTFFPLSSLVRRNPSSDIPDQVLERVFIILEILFDDWWWDCVLPLWEQVFMLCGAIIGGVEGNGKGRDRDEETKEAAARCLLTLLRPRTNRKNAASTVNEAHARFHLFKMHSQTVKFLPILGQTLDSVLTTVHSPSPSLQRVSLEILSLFIGEYAPDDLIPTVLPGVISNMTRLSLGSSKNKGWANGETVAGALNVMHLAIVGAIGDNICMKEGAMRQVFDLEDLVCPSMELNESPPTQNARPYSTRRTPSWLRGTSSQLLMAMNTLTPLVSHPTPSALRSLAVFSTKIIEGTASTLPQAQPLLLQFLLSLSNSHYKSISEESHNSLLTLLTTPSRTQHPLQQTLMRVTSENLLALPRLLPTHADAKVEHVAGLIEAVCRLAATKADNGKGLSSISSGIGRLLGPTGGIEKWGWNLLYVLEFVEPPVTAMQASSARLMLENNPDAQQWVPFPDIALKNVSSRSTQDALENMFRALGRAAGDSCLFSAEWFANVGRNAQGARSVAATWCACRLLEGVANISLSQGVTGDTIAHPTSKRLLKFSRSLAKNIAELWDDINYDGDTPPLGNGQDADDPNGNVLIQHVQGVAPVHETLYITRPAPAKEKHEAQQPLLHKVLSLQLLAVTSGVLQSQFSPLLLYGLYPVFQSLVSSTTYLSSTAFAALHFISTAMSYASPGNLLLSNFDYALDAVSRRLTRRWLDLEATKVLALMIRLVGSSVVDRAGDVVEECFDRLDEFHGYEVLVEGLVEVLGEVINVIKEDSLDTPQEVRGSAPSSKPDEVAPTLDDFFHWLAHRHTPPDEEVDTTDYGPAPREAWGPDKGDGPEVADEGETPPPADINEEPTPTPIQALTKQIVSRSLYFLTHGSPIIRARILSLLASSASVLPESAFLPSINFAWPFILNRLSDSEVFVVSAAASLVDSLATHFGSFMFRRIWDDVWPRFRVLLDKLDAADATSALSRRGYGAVGTESAYTHSHRLYRSLIKTMTAAVKGVHPHDASVWQVLLAFRRFLHKGAHQELQGCARDLYIAMGQRNPDVVWLALSSTIDDTYITMQFLRTRRWDIEENAAFIFQTIGI